LISLQIGFFFLFVTELVISRATICGAVWRINTLNFEPGLINKYSAWLRTGRSGLDSCQSKRVFVHHHLSRSVVRPVNLFKRYAYRLLLPKRPGREADHSIPSSTEVHNAWSCTSILRVFMAWCLIKHRDNFTLLTKDVSLSTVTTSFKSYRC
jgi:hypothetical protein